MTRAVDPVTPCRRGCCWNPFACATARTCQCHTADPELPTDEPPVRRYSYHDPVPGQAIRNMERNITSRPRTRGRRR